MSEVVQFRQISVRSDFFRSWLDDEKLIELPFDWSDDTVDFSVNSTHMHSNYDFLIFSVMKLNQFSISKRTIFQRIKWANRTISTREFKCQG